jgi:hypothetical protein
LPSAAAACWLLAGLYIALPSCLLLAAGCSQKPKVIFIKNQIRIKKKL